MNGQVMHGRRCARSWAAFAVWIGAAALALSQAALGQESPSPPASIALTHEIDLREELARTIEISCIETELSEVMRHVEKAAGIKIHIDRKALADVGIGLDTPLTHELRLPARSLLKHLLEPLDLTFVVRDGAVIVTTPEEANRRLLTRVYPAGDLLYGLNPRPGLAADYDTLMDLVTSTIAPTTWDDVGGPGSIDGQREAIVVAQTDEVHLEIEELFASLRRAREIYRTWEGRSALGGGAIVRGLGIESEASRRIQAVLEQPADFTRPHVAQPVAPPVAPTPSNNPFRDPHATGLNPFDDPFGAPAPAPGPAPAPAPAPAPRTDAPPMDGDTASIPLETTVELLRETIAERYGIPVTTDRKALADVGIGTDTAIHTRALGGRLRDELRRILADADLTIVVRADALVITTPEEANAKLLTRVYPVFDLIGEQFVAPHAKPLPAHLAWQITSPDADTLIDLVTSTIDPTTWDNVGGPGAIDFFLPAGSLVVSHTEETQEKIEQLLARLRRTGQITPKLDPARLARIAKEPVACLHRLTVANRTAVDQLASKVRKYVSPEAWRRQGFEVDTAGAALIVRAPPALQDAVAEFLDEIGASATGFIGGGSFGMHGHAM